MAEGYQGPRKERELMPVFEMRKLKLKTKNAEGRDATLAVSVSRAERDNALNPRFVVYSNQQGDKDAIIAKFDYWGFMSTLELLETAINFQPTAERPDFKDKAMTKRPNFKERGRPPEGTVTEAEVFVGKDKDGQVWIAISVYQRPQLKFVIQNDEFLEFQHGTGEMFSKGEASVLAAKGWLRIIRDTMPLLQYHNWKAEPPRDPNQQRGGGGGGYNRGGGNGGNGGGYGGGANRGAGGNYDRRGGGNTNGADFDTDVGGDDLPF